LSKDVSGLYQWLAYANAGEMLKAYGYEYELISSSGRPSSTDPHAIVRELIERYQGKDVPDSLGELIEQNHNREVVWAIKSVLVGILIRIR
jgi:hypothetical protein